MTNWQLINRLIGVAQRSIRLEYLEREEELMSLSSEIARRMDHNPLGDGRATYSRGPGETPGYGDPPPEV